MSEQLDLVIAKIQSTVAKLLLCKEKLIKYQSKTLTSDLKIDLDVLLKNQTELEAELTISLAKIEQIKAGKWAMQDIINLSKFYYLMTQHIKDTDNFVKKVKGEAIGTTGIDWQKVLTWGGAGLGIALLFNKFFKES